MGLKFKNILTEDEFPSKEGYKLKIKEEKLLKIIHDNVLLPFYDRNELPTELVDLDQFSELYSNIYRFLKDVMVFGDEVATHLFTLFVLNYNIEGDYKDIENVRHGLSYEEQLELFGEEIMFLAQHFKTLPFLIEPVLYPHYEMPSYHIIEYSEYYALGNQKELDAALKMYIDERFSNEEEVFLTYGSNTYMDYCVVGDTDKRMISSEESNHYESDMGEEEIIDRLKYEGSTKNKEIVEEYEQLKEEWDELPDSKDGSQYELRMEELVEEGRERVREIIYDDTYDRLENHLSDWLHELGYISKDRNGNVQMDSEQWDRLPSFVMFDWLEFESDELRDFEVEILSPYENVESVSLDNGDTYYMIQIDY
jgi:hypothetical protein